MSLNIAKSNKKRVVIVGGGFGGLKLANKLKKSGFQVVLIDKKQLSSVSSFDLSGGFGWYGANFHILPLP